MFNIVKIRKIKYNKRYALIEGIIHHDIGERYLDGDIQRGYIDTDGSWIPMPFDEHISTRVVDAADELICYVTIPKDFGMVCIALVQELTQNTLAVTPVYVAGYDIKRFETYCCKKTQ